MRVPPGLRWLSAALAVIGVAALGVWANLAVLASQDDDVRLGSLSARSLTESSSSRADARPVGGRVDGDDDAVRGGEERQDAHDDDD